jgi:hypothetical protein
MNLAIILSVSNYYNLGDLPCCKNDAFIMQKLLKSASKYDDILILDKSNPSDVEKQSLIEFIDKYKSSDIEEVFYYFSGHGDFDGDEFYYLLADYNSKKVRQTSLENSELDNLLRSLNSGLTVKVIDSCHSGIEYIKEKDSFYQYVKNTENSFSNCYFMFSSESNQRSYADESISHFTREFVKSVINHRSETVRFKNIIDYISDAFQNNNRQTPIFITQAEYTEIFCSKNNNLLDKIKGLLEESIADNATVSQGSPEKSLLKRIKLDAKNYTGEEEALKVLEKLKTAFFNAETPENISELFEIEKNERKDYLSLPNFSSVGWEIKYNIKENFFVKATYEVKKIDYDDLAPFERATLAYGSPKKISVINGAISTIDLPYNQLVILVNPKYPNLQKYALKVVPFLSQTSLLIFYSFVNYKREGWGNSFIPIDSKWLAHQISLKEKTKVQTFVSEVLVSFWNSILEPIIEKFTLVPVEAVETVNKTNS